MTNWARGLGTGLLFGIIAGSMTAQAGLGESDGHRLATAGGALTDEQARSLEAGLQLRPDDLEARTKLLGYYFLRASRSTEARRSKQGHVLWLARHRPEAEIAASPFADLDSHRDGETYEQAKALWLEQAKVRGKDVRVLGNAAAFVGSEDSMTAEELLLQAQALDPSSEKWPSALGQLYDLRLIELEGNARQPVAAKALQHYERALELAHSRDTVLKDVATAALEAGETTKARAFALELLAGPTQGWNQGNAVHHGNLVLGRLALQSGNVPEARESLLKAGQAPGSPQLNSFGPNMRLAKELLAKGERDVVLQYLQLCSKFWIMGGDRIANWTATVRGGGTPDFGANLDY